MKKIFLLLLVIATHSTISQTGQLNIFPQTKDKNGNIDNCNYVRERPFIQEPTIQSTSLYDSVRALSEINDVSNADAFPWISPDGLRIYYIHENASSGNEILFTQRQNVNSLFAAPTVVAINLTNMYSVWLSSDELDIYICTDSLYYAHRSSTIQQFNTPTQIHFTQPFTNGSFRSASLNSAQDVLYVSVYNGSYLGMIEYNRISPTAFTYSRTLPSPPGVTFYSGQLSKDELSFFVSASSTSYELLYELTRASISDSFTVNTFQRIQGINDTSQFNSQPSMSDSLTWVVFVRNNMNTWPANELFIAHLDFTSSVSSTELNNNSISLFPNPTSGPFTVLLPSNNAEIIITDIFGKQVIRQHATQRTLNLQIDKDGVYILYVKTKYGIEVQELVVSN